MDFKEQLNYYITDKLKCSSKELAESSGFSTSVISRYRNGERIPNNNIQLNKLANGISKLAIKYKIDNMDKDIILNELSKTVKSATIDFEQVQKKLNELISVLNINVAVMSRTLNFDPSYISRIRSGIRKPSNIENFINLICSFIVQKYETKTERTAIAHLICCKYEDILDNATYLSKLFDWFCSGKMEKSTSILDFLKKIDEFNLEDYIRLIHFNDLKVPSVPFAFPTNKSYYGIKEMKQGELDFFKSTVLSKSKEPVFMCSDMPMEDMAEDLDFGKKWMFAIAMTLKKGLHLNIIHNLDRPFNEMMLGLESWIPIYMTGQVSPYYLKGIQNNVYCHLNYVSGGAALAGECIKNFHNKGKYFLTNNKDEIAYYREKSNSLLKIANPLMDIYTKESSNVYNAFITADNKICNNRHNILSSPPFFTISENLLKNILKENSIDDSDIKYILDFRIKQKEIMENLLKQNIVLDEYMKLSKEEFEKHPISLSLSDSFYEKRILYTYDEYLEHLNMTNKFAQEHKNYKTKINNNIAFRNIKISIHENNWVMISKNTSPSIHFVIKHLKLRTAIESFIAPVVE